MNKPKTKRIKLTALKPRLQSVPSRLAPPQTVSNAKRIRGRKGQVIRHSFLQHHPLCMECEKRGIVRMAEEVDHIVALSNGGEDLDTNRQALCKPCHAAKTALDLGRRG
jgi:5-methylcytosine-specific restriction protein A